MFIPDKVRQTTSYQSAPDPLCIDEWYLIAERIHPRQTANLACTNRFMRFIVTKFFLAIEKHTSPLLRMGWSQQRTDWMIEAESNRRDVLVCHDRYLLWNWWLSSVYDDNWRAALASSWKLTTTSTRSNPCLYPNTSRVDELLHGDGFLGGCSTLRVVFWKGDELHSSYLLPELLTMTQLSQDQLEPHLPNGEATVITLVVEPHQVTWGFDLDGRISPMKGRSGFWDDPDVMWTVTVSACSERWGELNLDSLAFRPLSISSDTQLECTPPHPYQLQEHYGVTSNSSSKQLNLGFAIREVDRSTKQFAVMWKVPVHMWLCDDTDWWVHRTWGICR